MKTNPWKRKESCHLKLILLLLCSWSMTCYHHKHEKINILNVDQAISKACSSDLMIWLVFAFSWYLDFFRTYVINLYLELDYQTCYRKINWISAYPQTEKVSESVEWSCWLLLLNKPAASDKFTMNMLLEYFLAPTEDYGNSMKNNVCMEINKSSLL